MGVELKRDYALGIMGVFFAMGVVITAVTYLVLWILKRRGFSRSYLFLRKYVLPLQYLLSCATTSVSFIIGSAMGLYTPWLSVVVVSLFLATAWIHYSRKSLKESKDIQIRDLLDPQAEEEEYLVEDHPPQSAKKKYWESIVHGVRSSRWRIALGIAVGVFVAFSVTFTTDGLCVAVRPVSTSTRFTRFFEKDSCDKRSVCHVYFTVSDDSSTSVIVNFHSRDKPESGFVSYQELNGSFHATVKANWFRMEDLTEIERYVYWAEVVGLKPGTAYSFVTGYTSGGALTMSHERKIRTVPENGEATFVTGGDMQNDESGNTMSSVAASHEPYFAVVGGDIAYANGNVHCYKRWDSWFESWSKYMKTPSGFDIPFSLAIGNHEAGGDHGVRSKIPFFLHYFPQTLGLDSVAPRERPLYHSHKIGNHSMFMILDTGIVEGMTGNQYDWMEAQLKETTAVNKFAVYHYSLYPSITQGSSVDRSDWKAWVSLFSNYNLTIAFENHLHLFKRSKTIKDDTTVQSPLDGTTYLGDGAWGMENSDPFMNPDSWWIDSVSRTPHVFIVSTSQDFVKVNAVTEQNDIFNTFIIDRRANQVPSNQMPSASAPGKLDV